MDITSKPGRIIFIAALIGAALLSQTKVNLQQQGKPPISDTPAAATYLTLTSEVTLPNSRRLIAGPGIGPLIDSGPAGTLMVPLDASVALTQVTAQGGVPWLCDAQSGDAGLGFACWMSPTLQQYTRGQFVVFIPSVDCRAGAILDIDKLGPVPLLKILGGGLIPGGGTVMPVGLGDCLAGVPYMLLGRGNPVNAWILR